MGPLQSRMNAAGLVRALMCSLCAIRYLTFSIASSQQQLQPIRPFRAKKSKILVLGLVASMAAAVVSEEVEAELPLPAVALQEESLPRAQISERGRAGTQAA